MFRWKKKPKVPTLDGSSSDIPGKPTPQTSESQSKSSNHRGLILGSAKGHRGSTPSLLSSKRNNTQKENSNQFDQTDGTGVSVNKRHSSYNMTNGISDIHIENIPTSNGYAGSIVSDSTLASKDDQSSTGLTKKRQAPPPPPRGTSLPRGDNLDSDILPLSPTTTSSNDFRWSLRSGASSGSSLSHRSLALSLPNSDYLTGEVGHTSAFSPPMPSKILDNHLQKQNSQQLNGTFSGSTSERSSIRKDDCSSLTSESVSETSLDAGSKSPVPPPRSRNVRKKSLGSTSSNASSLSEREFKVLKHGAFSKYGTQGEKEETKGNLSQPESDHGYGTFTVQEKNQYLEFHNKLQHAKNVDSMATKMGNPQYQHIRTDIANENSRQLSLMTRLQQSEKIDHLNNQSGYRTSAIRDMNNTAEFGSASLLSRKAQHSRTSSRSSDSSVRKTLDFSEGDEEERTNPPQYTKDSDHYGNDNMMLNNSLRIREPSTDNISSGLPLSLFYNHNRTDVEHCSDFMPHLSRMNQEEPSNDWLDKPVSRWTENDVIGWCHGVGLEQLKDVFEDSGITGPKLLRLTKEDLVDLNLHDVRSQQHFMEEVNNLKQNKVSKSLWTLKQSSVRRKHLEFSNLQIKSNLECLKKESAEQQERIAASLKALRDERQETEQILLTSPIRSPGGALLHRGLSSSVESICTLADESFTYRQRRSSTGTVTDLPATIGDDDYLRVPLMYWGTMEVLKWLSSVGLDRFLDNFKALKISGRQLAQIDLKLLDDLQITSVGDREEILSRLYDLQHQSDVSTVPVPASPVVKNIMKPPVPVKTPNLLNKKRTSPRSSLKVTPAKSPGYKPKDNNTIQVWNDLNCPGNLVGTFLKVNESTSTQEVIQMLLGPSRMQNEADLFYIIESLQHKHTEVRELGKNECPLIAQRQWPSTSAGKLELRHRNGRVISITNKISGIRSKTKQFRISYDAVTSDVLQHSLQKFHISHMDHSMFCLLEMDKERKENHIVMNSDLLRNCKSDAFLLCERNNIPMTLDLSVIHPSSESGRRQPSLDSQHSHSSKHSSDSDPHRTIHFDKLETLEAEMASIEASFFSKGNNSSVQSSRQVAPKKQTLPSSQYYNSSMRSDDDNLELLREIELLKESIKDRDTTIAAVSHENKRLQERSKQVVALRERLSQVEEAFMLAEEKWQEQLANEQKPPPSKPTAVSTSHSAVQTCTEADEVRGQIEWVDSQIQQNELKINNIQNTLDQKPPSINHEDLLHQQMAAKSVVEMLNQEKSDLKSQLSSLLDESSADDDKKEVKQSSLPKLNTFQYLSENSSVSLVCVELDSLAVQNSRVVKDNESHLVVKHVQPGCSLSKNDRILEINGQQAIHLSESEFYQLLNEAESPIKSVVLRDKSNNQSSNSVDADEYEIMKEDLEVTVMELETANLENAELIEELEKCKAEILTSSEEKDQLNETLSSLEKQLSEARNNVKDLQSVIDHHKAHNNNVTVTPPKPPRDDLEKRKLKEALVSRLEKQIKETAGKMNHMTEDNQSMTDVCYEDLDDSKPLWESLKDCSKGMILQALRDTIGENSQRKVFLDQLLSLVIDRSPELLEYVEENMEMPKDVSLKAEKFC